MVQITSVQIKKWKTWSDLIVTWITLIGTLTGAVYALFQYIDNTRADRAKETLKFVERFESDRMYASRQRVDAALQKLEGELINNYKKGEAVYSDCLNAGIKDSAISHDLDQIFDFYDQLQACSLSSLCDKDISLRFFGKYAFDLVGTIYPYMEQQQKQFGDAQYGSGIKFYFNKFKDQRKKQ